MGGDVVEGESEFVEGESDGGDHGGTSVFELGGAEEGSGGFRSVFGGEFVPVVFTDEDWFSAEGGGAEAWDCGFDFEEFGLGVEGGVADDWCLGGRGGEGGSGSDEEGEEGEFHGGVVYLKYNQLRWKRGAERDRR